MLKKLMLSICLITFSTTKPMKDTIKDLTRFAKLDQFDNLAKVEEALINIEEMNELQREYLLYIILNLKCLNPKLTEQEVNAQIALATHKNEELSEFNLRTLIVQAARQKNDHALQMLKNIRITAFPESLFLHNLCCSFLMKIIKCEACAQEIEDNPEKLPCGHQFHLNCAIKHLSKTGRCPICQTQAPQFKIIKINSDDISHIQTFLSQIKNTLAAEDFQKTFGPWELLEPTTENTRTIFSIMHQMYEFKKPFEQALSSIMKECISEESKLKELDANSTIILELTKDVVNEKDFQALLQPWLDLPKTPNNIRIVNNAIQFIGFYCCYSQGGTQNVEKILI
ncbi:MAG: hypothetical protein UR26_C0010G0002 [candidate division TM6 bacterium GW2011_GWF2_32_72]|nr:MAG: hypothetical protein UR26_C0010G0002 [candidate division TM6 bacterium GW2011_GWF2_32_72]